MGEGCPEVKKFELVSIDGYQMSLLGRGTARGVPEVPCLEGGLLLRLEPGPGKMSLTVRSNASRVLATWDHPKDRQTDTFHPTLASHNFVGGR